MRLIATYVVRQEASRWLSESLESVRPHVDQIFVMDDRSTDATPEICHEYTDHVYRRPDSVPSFVEDEGGFRSAAWDLMAVKLRLSWNDWVLAVDADELVVSEVKGTFRQVCEWNIRTGRPADGFRVPIREVFDIDDDGAPLVRTDGWWDSTSGVRIKRFDGDRWRPGPACGSTPSPRVEAQALGVSFLHLGYARQSDREAKHAWYVSRGGFGHNPKHIRSILQTPTLVRYENARI